MKKKAEVVKLRPVAARKGVVTERTPTARDPTGARIRHEPVGPATASIVQIYGPGLGRRHVLTRRTVIGREVTADVPVDLPSVSRHHASLFQKDGAWWVADLGSTNGTFIGSTEVLGEARLKSGDVLRSGGAIFKFLAGGDIEALYHEEIYRLTITDGLTGIHNKRYFMEALAREAARARRRNRALSVVMLDIDHFKTLNDTYGHVTGDHLLQQVAQLLQAQVRVDEEVARYGGDEFAVVLPEADHAEVGGFCDRVRSAVENRTFDFDGVGHHLTVSLGASSMPPAHGIDDLVRAADEQLFRAKKKGRNRACIDVPTGGEKV